MLLPHGGSLRVTTTNHELSYIALEGCVNLQTEAWTVPRERIVSETLRPVERSLTLASGSRTTAALNHRVTSSSDLALTSLKLTAEAR